MRLIILAIFGLLPVLAVPCMAVAGDGWRDPFTCDPYVFEFDIPMSQEGPVVAPLIIRSTCDDQQVITLSMWPEYSDAQNIAPSEWFAIEPSSGVLPVGGLALFNIIYTPPTPPSAFDGMTYYTYVRVARTVNGAEYWERPLPVRIRFGSAIPSASYAVEGWKIGQIRGRELTDYTQDQITLAVSNRSTLSDLYVVLYPVAPSPPSTEDIQSENQGFMQFVSLWRDPHARSVYAEPVGDINPETGVYDEYRLYYDSNKGRREFGKFLAASYSRVDDVVHMGAYPYRIVPRQTAQVPFVLQVDDQVPAGIYRLQIHVAPVGGYSPGNMGIQYESKIALQIERGGTDIASLVRGSIGWVILCSLTVILGIAVANYIVTSRRPRQEVVSGG